MNKTTIAVVAAVGGGIVGGVLTYITVNQALRTRYEDWANEQIDSVKARYAEINKDSKRSILEAAENPSQGVQEAVEAGKRLVAELGYSADEAVHDPTATRLSIFDSAVETDDEGNPIEEDVVVDAYVRVDGEPFLISEHAYFENEEGYELDTLTYYNLDDTLTDEHNDRIDRVEETVGVRHLSMFPKNGTEKTSLYIQNDEHHSLYEIILVEQSYAVVHLGMSEEDLGLVEPKQKLKKMKRDAD